MDSKLKLIYNFLVNEGFNPEIINEVGDIRFATDNDKYCISFDKNIICLSSIWIIIEIEENKILNLCKLINSINLQYIGKCKYRINKYGKDQLIEMSLETLESFESFMNNFYEYLDEIIEMKNYFMNSYL